MTDERPLLLDTHVWFRHQALPMLLRPGLVEVIDKAANRSGVFISVISVWELAMLERAGRIELDGGAGGWCADALAKPGIHLLPLSPRIAVDAVHLPEPMHKDPADRILVASARVERMILVTSDRAILAFARQAGLGALEA